MSTYLVAHQVLKSSHKGSAQTALVQIFGITQVNNFMNHLQNIQMNIVMPKLGERVSQDLSRHAVLYLSTAVLENNVFWFQVPVYDLVFMQILNATSWIRGQQLNSVRRF